MSKLTTYFTKSELLLWSASLIYCAKGNPFGQFLMVVFSIMYGAISYTFDYYGEMITYVGMTGPMALFALVAWLRNPYNGNRAEVKVNELTKREIVFMFILAGIVTYAFYFILKNFNTANLAPSTLSVTTSFIGVYLTFRRSAYYALAYALNDIILILLWTLATLTDISYMSVIICFVMFLVNDLYGFINWSRMKKTQKNYGKQIGIMVK